jgi:hypothetical protein
MCDVSPAGAVHRPERCFLAHAGCFKVYTEQHVFHSQVTDHEVWCSGAGQLVSSTEAHTISSNMQDKATNLYNSTLTAQWQGCMHQQNVVSGK